jgi:hypothetical protein
MPLSTLVEVSESVEEKGKKFWQVKTNLSSSSLSVVPV